MRGGSEKGIERGTSSKAKKNVGRTERAQERDTDTEMRRILGGRGQAERRDEKLDLQICLDYYEIARLLVAGCSACASLFLNDPIPRKYYRAKHARVIKGTILFSWDTLFALFLTIRSR